MLILKIACIAMVVPLIAGCIAVLVWGRRFQTPRPFPGLLFHAIPSEKISGLSYCRVDTFHAFAHYLKENAYSALTVSHACRNRPTNGASALKTVVLTFDDGFEDFYYNVFPVLKTYGLHASIFPITSYIGACSQWDIYTPRKHLNAAQIREIAQDGCEIGSHTMTHPDLLYLSKNDVISELADSKKALEDILSKPVTSISFPYGRWNMRIWKLAQDCGYEYAAIYGKRLAIADCFIHVAGVYSFDSRDDIIEKTEQHGFFSASRARSRIMPHFAKGSSVWHFRKNYHISV